jgi:hypothetical protein
VIRLTLSNGIANLFAPHKITQAGERRPIDLSPRNFIIVDDHEITVRESPADVARLLAAWELRLNASELRGTLPIAVGMTEAGDGVEFHCCQYTARLKAEREALKASRPKLLSWPKPHDWSAV